MSDLEKAVRYRNRAAQLRKIAESLTDGRHRDMLVQIADEFEAMAAEVENAIRQTNVRT